MRGRMRLVAAARLDQRLRERRRGALGRHVNRRARQIERPARAGKALDQLALDQRAASVARNGAPAGMVKTLGSVRADSGKA